ncbi:MAG: alpha/beta hydrolase [Anaerolineales bacterium]|nr:MAG: alpha/beta hydrolase [Anaerolineales bacterium]
MSAFVPWDSQPLDVWAQKYARGKWIDLDGKSTHYTEAGSGEPLILLHGFFFDHHMWDKNIALEIGEELHRILKSSRLEILDQAGHCPQDDQPEHFNRLALDFLTS